MGESQEVFMEAELTHLPDMILTIIVLSFWFIFPIGMFLSVSHVDKNTDQIVRLGHLRHDSVDLPRNAEAGMEVDTARETDRYMEKKQNRQRRRSGRLQANYRH